MTGPQFKFLCVPQTSFGNRIAKNLKNGTTYINKNYFSAFSTENTAVNLYIQPYLIQILCFVCSFSCMFTYMYASAPCMFPDGQGGQNRHWITQSYIRNSLEPPSKCYESKPSLPQEQQMLLTIELLLQSNFFLFSQPTLLRAAFPLYI